MKSKMQDIPKALIYELDRAKPIYYRNYKAYLKGTKQLEELMGSSYLQALIISKIMALLLKELGEAYVILTNEVGLQLGKKSWRAADIAVYLQTQLEDVKLEDKLLTVPPKYVIEVDTKASLEGMDDFAAYYHTKTDQLLDFGVETIIWIFTGAKKVMIARKRDKNWSIGDWEDTEIVVEQCNFKISDLLPNEK